MVRFDRWFSLMCVVVIVAYLFRDTFVKVAFVERPVGTTHGNVVEFDKRGAA